MNALMASVEAELASKTEVVNTTAIMEAYRPAAPQRTHLAAVAAVASMAGAAIASGALAFGLRRKAGDGHAPLLDA